MSASWLWLLAVLYNVVVGAASPRHQPGSSRLLLRVANFQNCDGPEMPVRLLERKLKWSKDRGHLVDATLLVARAVKSIRLGAVELHRCRDLQGANTCEYYATWAWKTGICNLIVLPNMMWTPLMQSISPPLACPVKAGTYHATNSTWDLSSPVFKQVMGDGMLWKGDMIMTDQNNATIMCLRGAVQGVKQTVQ